MEKIINPNNIPEGLKNIDQWVIWKAGKRPLNALTGKPAKIDDPSTWATYDKALKAIEQGLGIGVGFVFTDEDPYVAIDFDKVMIDGILRKDIQAIVEKMASYTEISQSGTGLHVIIKGRKPGSKCRKGEVEIYDCKRYFALTGDVYQGRDTIEERQEELDWLCSDVFGDDASSQAQAIAATDLVLDPAADPPQEKMDELLENDRFVEIWNHSAEGLASMSDYDWRLVSFALNDGWTDQEIADLIIAFRRTQGSKDDLKKALRKDYIPRTITSVKNAPQPDLKRLAMATQLVKLAGDLDLFHNADGIPYASFQRDGHFETWPLKSSTMKDYLSRLYYTKTGSTVRSTAIADAIAELRGHAVYDGREEQVFRRLACHDGKIYLDLCNSEWSVVEITAERWQVIARSPVYFVRAKGMAPLPVPLAGGRIEQLLRLINIDDSDRPLLVGWILGTFMGNGPYPVLIILGEHGSSKSLLMRMIRMFIDPSNSLARSLPRTERDLAINASNSWIVAYDNVSFLPDWMSDAICRLATGGGFGIRENYTDDEEMIFKSKRPVMLNGISEIATRPDLLDRAIIVTLPVIPDDERRTEADIWGDFHEAYPSVLGALLNAVSLGLKKVGEVKLDSLPRMADFAKWVVAAMPGLDLNPEDFLKAYSENRESINEIVLESSPIARWILKLVGDGDWTGTATDLLDELNSWADDRTQRSISWPKNARSLSAMLKRIAPNFRKKGVDIQMYREEGERRIHIIDKLRGQGGDARKRVKKQISINLAR